MDVPHHFFLIPVAGALIVGLLWILRLRERIASAEARMDFLLHRDALTGLPNHRLARDRLEFLIAQAKRDGTKVAVVVADLDRFKPVNDSLGCQAGDALLRKVALRLSNALRNSDTVSRQSGDEFLVLLNTLRDGDAAIGVASKLLGALADPFPCGETELVVSASMGIAICPDDGADFDTLVRKANMALFHAKQGGGNSYRFFNERMNADGARHLRTVHGLRRALDQGDFVLHYQPQYDIRSGEVVGAEALVRWQCPERGMVPPNEFIPIAEQSGLIIPLGEWILHEACRKAAEWQTASALRPTIAVNVSALQFNRGNIEASIVDVLKKTGLDPSRLELEITESMMLQDREDVLQSVRHLERIGVRFAIDDFGTGYSSLSYLRRFAVHKLKIDRSFIKDLPNHAGSAAIVRAIIQMARGLGLQAIAEGIEDQWSLDFLKENQCEFAQGYFLCRPLPERGFEELLMRNAGPGSRLAAPAAESRASPVQAPGAGYFIAPTTASYLKS
ncbi:MAG TPA: EAL domain-containing protein [Azospirillum sp.]|nr:EAL domain-containing protein [Azospirillum sp.]